MALIDTHCHLNLDAFTEDRDIVISRSSTSGVHSIIVPGIDIPSSITAIELANRYSLLYAAVGVHPNSMHQLPSDWVSTLSSIANNKKVVAIGEIGLDFYRSGSLSGLQIEVLEKQLQIAEEKNLPVIIHNRKASPVIGELLMRWQRQLKSSSHPLADTPGVFHSFEGDYELAIQAIHANFYLGVNGTITFLNAKSFQELVAKLPLDHLLLETDAPFLSPHPLRGKRNEPANLRLISQKISELMKLSAASVEDITTYNAERLFRIPQ